ncbi:MAG: hypothetical protein WBC18_17700 [Ottowia sp.]|uniref:hypothetical protein n=1 Tax=Ottowia sp. TaxID=1898956 RepID=UPI003C77CD69
MSEAKLSTIQLTVMTPLDQREAKYGHRDLQVLVHIDGKECGAGAYWEFHGIFMGALRPGRYFLSNCDCGAPGCAGIYWPAIIEHKGGMVHWNIPQQPGEQPPDMPKRLRFDRKAYLAECEQFAELLDRCCNELSQPGVESRVTGDPFVLAQFHKFFRLKWGVQKPRMRRERRLWKRDGNDGGGYRWQPK